MLELTRMFDVGRAAAKTQERGADDDDDVEYRRHGRFGVMSIIPKHFRRTEQEYRIPFQPLLLTFS